VLRVIRSGTSSFRDRPGSGLAGVVLPFGGRDVRDALLPARFVEPSYNLLEGSVSAGLPALFLTHSLSPVIAAVSPDADRYCLPDSPAGPASSNRANSPEGVIELCDDGFKWLPFMSSAVSTIRK